MAGKSCVVYASANPGVRHNSILAAAQAYAIEHHLPLAVAHCIETTDGGQILKRLANLEAYETFLAARHIPFMVLLGSVDTVLPWFMSHTTPEKVFDDDSEFVTANIQHHPYDWPGRVMTIAELKEMVAGDSNYCHPATP